MSNFPAYTTKTFRPTQKFFVIDPNTGSPAFVQGSDLVSQLTPNSSYVFAESTRTTAQATDYELGAVIQTGGATAAGDNLAGVYLVVPAGDGDFPMDNGLELLTLAGDDTLLERLALNTAGDGSDLVAHTGTTNTVTEAIDQNIADINQRTIYVGSVAELEGLTPISNGQQVVLAGPNPGQYTWATGDYTTDIATDPDGVNYVAWGADTSPGATGAWVAETFTVNSEVIELTVGAGGDYATINEALEAASRVRNVYVQGDTTRDALVRIRLLAGFVMAEQVFAEGIDLSWIVITSDDAEVAISREALTLSVSGRFPAFGARDGGCPPIIGALFNMDSTGVASARDGVFVTNQCKAYVLTGCGVKNAGERGFHVANNSRGQARGSVFEGASTLCARISNNSTANLRGANLSNGGTGIACNGAVVAMAEADVSGSNNPGIFAQGSWIYAREIIGNNCQLVGGDGFTGAIEAQEGSTVIAAGASLNNSGGRGVTCYESTVILSREETGQVGSATGATDQAIYALGGTVIAKGCDLSGAGSNAIFAGRSANVEASSADLDNSGSAVIRAEGGSKVSANSASAASCSAGIVCLEGSEVIAANIALTNCAGQPVNCTTGGKVTVPFADFVAPVGETVASRGGTIIMSNVDARRSPSGTNDISISNGGIVHADGSQGVVNVAVNTLSAAGYVLR